jgi:hypothetical protein
MQTCWNAGYRGKKKDVEVLLSHLITKAAKHYSTTDEAYEWQSSGYYYILSFMQVTEWYDQLPEDSDVAIYTDCENSANYGYGIYDALTDMFKSAKNLEGGYTYWNLSSDEGREIQYTNADRSISIYEMEYEYIFDDDEEDDDADADDEEEDDEDEDEEDDDGDDDEEDDEVDSQGYRHNPEYAKWELRLDEIRCDSVSDADYWLTKYFDKDVYNKDHWDWNFYIQSRIDVLAEKDTDKKIEATVRYENLLSARHKEYLHLQEERIKAIRDFVQNNKFDSIDVVGTQYEDRIELIKVLQVGDAITLCREKTNSYDRNAFAVQNGKNASLGHLSAELAGQLAPLVDSEVISLSDAKVSGVDLYTKAKKLRAKPLLQISFKIKFIAQTQ